MGHAVTDDPARAVRPTAASRTVVVIDDHRTLADLLGAALSAEPDLDCVGVAYDLVSGLDLVRRHGPDLVVIDNQFKGDDRQGVDVAARIRAERPGTQVMLLTGHADTRLMNRAAAAGVGALMAKDGSLPDLLTAMRTMHGGGLVVNPGLLRALMAEGGGPLGPSTDLSPRERDVLALLSTGLDARAIAGRLGISLSTCRGYVKTLLHKLHAHTQLEAVAVARRQGLLDAVDVG
jgi:DNA-binding NarL/FixJ family response regulator